MLIELRLETTPGEKTLFLTEAIFQYGEILSHSPYKSLWLTWWIYRPKFWKEMLWNFKNQTEDGWRVFTVELLGFELTYQSWRDVEKLLVDPEPEE